MSDGGIQIGEAVCADAEEILALQRRAYQSEAAIYEDYSLPPLLETLEELRDRFRDHLFLKAVRGNRIVGSVRAREENAGSEPESPDSSLRTPGSSLKTPDSSLRTQDSSLKTQNSEPKEPGVPQRGRVCHVARLIVDPAIQNQGLGTRLLLEVEARFPGARRFELFTGHKSERNLLLYRKLGYRVWKTEFAHERLDLVYLAKARPPKGGERTTSISHGEKAMRYECIVCGYIYDPALGDPDNGVEPGTLFEDVPQDWLCPDCGVGKDQFTPVD